MRRLFRIVIIVCLVLVLVSFSAVSVQNSYSWVRSASDSAVSGSSLDMYVDTSNVVYAIWNVTSSEDVMYDFPVHDGAIFVLGDLV